MPALAGGTTYYYSRMNASAVGAGLVYADENASQNPNYQTSSSATHNTASTGDGHTYYLYAQASEGHYFNGWYKNEACTDLLSTDAQCTYTVQATSTNQGSPTNFSVWAKFEEAIYTYYSTMTVRSQGQGQVAVNVLKEDAPFYASEANDSQEGAQSKHIYYIYAQAHEGYVFSGWFSDEECTQLVSNTSKYTFAADVESTDEFNPSEFILYAKFRESTDIYQLQNSGFEDWEDVDGGREPLAWNSFLTCTGSMAGTVKAEQLTRSEDAHGGQYSARLNSRNVIFNFKAQGNMTTGCINGGSMSATDANGNYNYTNEENPGQAMRFTGRPDALKVWVKSNCPGGDFKIAAMLHEKGYYQDPNTGNTDRLCRLVGQAAVAPADNDGVWTEYTVPFSYTTSDRNDRPYYALVSFATNSTPGGGGANDVIYVDDITMVYYSELASARVAGRLLSFDAEGNANSYGSYDPMDLELVKKGAGAQISTSYNDETKELTIVVTGDDIADNPGNQHTYTITYLGTEPEPTQEHFYKMQLVEDNSLYFGMTTELYDGNDDNVISGAFLTDSESATIITLKEGSSANTVIITDAESHYTLGIATSKYWNFTTTDAAEWTMTEGADGSVSFTISNVGGTGATGYWKVDEMVEGGYLYTDGKSATLHWNLIEVDDPDAIRALSTNSHKRSNLIFNLQGQQLQKLQKGLNIINNKKVLVK